MGERNVGKSDLVLTVSAGDSFESCVERWNAPPVQKDSVEIGYTPREYLDAAARVEEERAEEMEQSGYRDAIAFLKPRSEGFHYSQGYVLGCEHRENR